MSGKVYLVGAGPGDPELLTVKALRLLRSADAILHDELVTPEILRMANPAARLHNVGKRCGQSKITQEEINRLLVRLAVAGLEVVRLKAGDPLIFGRGGEEIEVLQRAEIAYEIVPGITAALGAAAVAGIPLTHRRGPSAIIFLTAHRAPENVAAEWGDYARSGATLVIYMPGHDYQGLARRLRNAGLRREAPCAIISGATTATQQVHFTSVGKLSIAPRQPAPALLIVGEVAGLANAQPGCAPLHRAIEQLCFSIPGVEVRN